MSKEAMERKNAFRKSRPVTCTRCGREATGYSFDEETQEYVCLACQCDVELPPVPTKTRKREG